MESAEVGAPVRILLVGFMGSGKTTVGRLLSEGLGWTFADFDDWVEEHAGEKIETIFRKQGEARFRALEAEGARALLACEGCVLASGGGWAAAPGRLRSLPEGTLSVWLRVSAEVALERVRGADTVRPLLEDEDPLGRARALLQARLPHYGEAQLAVMTDGREPTAVAREILNHLESVRVDMNN